MGIKKGSENRRSLGFQFDDEFPSRVVKLCKVVADRCARHPLFRDAASEHILDYLALNVCDLLSDHTTTITSTGSDSALGASHTIPIAIDYDSLCCNLTVAAFEKYVLATHDSALQ